MNQILVQGIGAVSPAGWGVPALRQALKANLPWPVKPLARPGWDQPLQVRSVPAPSTRPAFFAHPRVRRVSPITQHTIAAALEALGSDLPQIQSGGLQLGLIVCAMPGCVNYSRRFYEEVLKDPATASPLIFPETIFNAPASHLAAYLSATAINYTLVGDECTFPQGLALAAQWLTGGQVDGCLVIGAEETDWVVADAMHLFDHDAVHGDGAGAVYLKKDRPTAASVKLACVTDAFLFTQAQNRATAAQKMRVQLENFGSSEALCLSTQGLYRADAAEETAWHDYNGFRVSPKAILGEAFTASAAWQCVWACDAVRRGEFSAANVSVVGTNQAAIGVRFIHPDSQNAT